MAKDNIARGLANAALTEVYEIHGIAQLTTPERLGLSPSNPMFVFDTTLETYFAYNTVMGEWIAVGSSLWGGMTGDITRQQDLVDFLHSDNITTTINKQFVSKAEKDRWNGNTNTHVVDSVAALDTLSPNTGDLGIVLEDDKATGYLYNNGNWIKTSDPAWENINIDWNNIINKPEFEWKTTNSLMEITSLEDTHTTLSEVSGLGYRAAWSPDGKYLAHTQGDFTKPIALYSVSGDTYTAVDLAHGLVNNEGWGVTWSSDGNYLTFALAHAPYALTYKRTGSTFTKVVMDTAIPNNNGAWTVAWSPDNTKLAVTLDNNGGEVLVYKMVGGVLELQTTLTIAGAAWGVNWSPQGDILALAHNGAPYLTLCADNGGSFTQLPAPANTPSFSGNQIAWTKNGKFMLVGHEGEDAVSVYSRNNTTFTYVGGLGISTGVYDIALDSREEYLAVALMQGNAIYKFDSIAGGLSHVESFGDNHQYGVAWRPDSKRLLATGQSTTSTFVYRTIREPSADLHFYRGKQTNIPAVGTPLAFYLAEDTKQLYKADENGKPFLFSDVMFVDVLPPIGIANKIYIHNGLWYYKNGWQAVNGSTPPIAADILMDNTSTNFTSTNLQDFVEEIDNTLKNINPLEWEEF